VEGHIAGTWKRSLVKGKAELSLTPFRRWSVSARRMIADAAGQYGEYLGLPVAVTWR
jgi:hypothetical protein